MTIDEALTLKEEAAREIQKTLRTLTERTGLIVSTTDVDVIDTTSYGGPKSCQYCVELRVEL